MAVRIESLAEPLPGYRLLERLGGGGFGDPARRKPELIARDLERGYYTPADARDKFGRRAAQ